MRPILPVQVWLVWIPEDYSYVSPLLRKNLNHIRLYLDCHLLMEQLIYV